MIKLCLILIAALLSTTAFAGEGSGTNVGGGGDPTEAGVDLIRADILKWIGEGGYKELKFPKDVSLEFYEREMTKVLTRKAIVVTFVTSEEEKNTVNPELKVSIDGFQKTCRSFKSKADGKTHMLCNSDKYPKDGASQYRLIHHEYAALARVEKNDGAWSDYEVSNQITDYLKPETVLRLSLKKNEKPARNSRNPQMPKSTFDAWMIAKTLTAMAIGAVTEQNRNEIVEALRNSLRNDGKNENDKPDAIGDVTNEYLPSVFEAGTKEAFIAVAKRKHRPLWKMSDHEFRLLMGVDFLAEKTHLSKYELDVLYSGKPSFMEFEVQDENGKPAWTFQWQEPCGHFVSSAHARLYGIWLFEPQYLDSWVKKNSARIVEHFFVLRNQVSDYNSAPRTVVVDPQKIETTLKDMEIPAKQTLQQFQVELQEWNRFVSVFYEEVRKNPNAPIAVLIEKVRIEKDKFSAQTRSLIAMSLIHNLAEVYAINEGLDFRVDSESQTAFSSLLKIEIGASHEQK